MKILLDECVPWPVFRLLPAHTCQPVQRIGLAGIKNGNLLRLIEGKYDLFITTDQSLVYQNNLTGYSTAILQVSTNNCRKIVAAAEQLRRSVDSMKAGEFRRLAIP